MDPIEKRFKDVYTSSTFKRVSQTLHTEEFKVLDLGCGYGEYMQRFGKGSVGITSTPDEVAYGTQKHIDIRLGNVERLDEVISEAEQFDMIWANNLFEHLLSPHAFLVHLKQFARKDTLLVLGVPVIPKIESLVHLSKFRGALASPHINFFSKKTFELTVSRAGWNLMFSRPFIFKSAALDGLISSYMPHLYLVAKNDSTYKYPPKKVREWENDSYYQNLLSIMDAENTQ